MSIKSISVQLISIWTNANCSHMCDYYWKYKLFAAHLFVDLVHDKRRDSGLMFLSTFRSFQQRQLYHGRLERHH